MTVYYEAFDGTKFTDEDECLDYERVATLKEEIANGSTVILDDDFEVLDIDKMSFDEIIDKARYIKIHSNTVLSEEISFVGIGSAHGDLFYYYDSIYGKFLNLKREVEYKEAELAKFKQALNILEEKSGWE